MLKVTVEAPVRPSEDPNKVERALRTLLPSGDAKRHGGVLVIEGASLDAFRNLIWKEKILDAARRVLLASLTSDGRKARFALSKQAAFAGHASFAIGKAPLGDVTVTVEGEALDEVFKEIAPPTLNGRPVTKEQYEAHLERQRKLKMARKAVSPAAAGPVAAEEE